MIDSGSTPEALHLCCDSSFEAGEPLHATASRVDAWLLLEYNAAWGAKALAESTLPDSVKAYLNRWQTTIPNARFQFIKQIGRQAGVRFYVARSNPVQAELYRFDLTAYEDLLALDLAGVIEGRVGTPSDERLFLVCTNGKRDMCCAKHGLPLYRAMSEAAGDAVWETTHIGGHRFAGTLVCLPHGLYYGRATPAQAGSIAEAYQREEIALDLYRGCSSYSAPEQAADHFLRQERGLGRIADVSLIASEKLAENDWQVRFETQDGQKATIGVRVVLSELMVYESSKDIEKKRVTRYHCGFV